jgi:hypothetical protein
MAKTWRRLPAKTRFCHLDEQVIKRMRRIELHDKLQFQLELDFFDLFLFLAHILSVQALKLLFISVKPSLSFSAVFFRFQSGLVRLGP